MEYDSTVTYDANAFRAADLAPSQVWSDGVHFVRAASRKDRHAMRWVVAAHKGTGSTYKRHAPTEADAIVHAKTATQRWVLSNPADASKVSGFTPPVASAKVAPKVTLERFATTCFTCIVANPYAQVWQCTSLVGEAKPIGRRREGGRAPEQAPVRHAKEECAVLIGEEPVRDPDGRVRVFSNWLRAEEYATELYENAPEEEVILWKKGDQRVGATPRIDIIFDPANNGDAKPFSLYLVEFRRPIFEDRTRPILEAAKTRSKRAAGNDAQLQIMINEVRSKHRNAHREPSFEERTLRFRSIWNALAEADRRERMMNGELV